MGTGISTVAVIAPGDMGHAVGAVMRQNGLRVVTCLRERSERTRALAAKAGIEDLPDDASLVRAADALLAILVPARARELAERIASALRATGADLLYVDCNAIAPETTRRVGAIVEAAGARFVDAGIIGPPPAPGSPGTRFYASGASARQFVQLRDYGLDVRVIDAAPGDASALKMCYAALTKGTTAIMTELALAAERLGVSQPLREELALSQPQMLERLRRAVPGMIPKAHRWVGEMEEIARTFEAAGLTPLTFAGAAELYALVAATPSGGSRQKTGRARPHRSKRWWPSSSAAEPAGRPPRAPRAD
jgi:3-hydroxyisobutyrate dehydrogenase-like beta-hydroxyacid dehydrogenase